MPKIDFLKEISIRSDSGAVAQFAEIVVPIFKAKTKPFILECTGTGFVISPNGLCVTAAHVFHDILEENKHAETGILTGVFQPPDKFLLCKIEQISMNNEADVAVGMIESLNPNEPFPHFKALTLTTDTPLPGEEVSTIAFPQTKTKVKGKKQGIYIQPTACSGVVNKEYREGRDNVLLPGPCYETTLIIEGGASGGPVVNSKGCVFGVNSTGINQEEIGFVSHIQGIGGLPIKNYRNSDGSITKSIKVIELIKKGEVKVEASENPPLALSLKKPI